MKETNAVPHDDLFVIEVSESMELRNQLRTGLLEAQNRNPSKIPLYVSWPKWLDNGIVCIYASDFRDILKKAIGDAIEAVSGKNAPVSSFNEENAETEPPFQAFDIGALDHLQSPRSAPRGKK